MHKSILTHHYMPFIDNGIIKVFEVPVCVDMIRARKAIQNMLDLNNSIRYKFKIGKDNG